jgi:hypothetical protein
VEQNFTGRSSCNETKPKKERSLPLSLSQNTKPLPKKNKHTKTKKPGIEGMGKPEKK